MNTSHDTGGDHIAERVLGRIDLEHLTPRPRWAFTAKNALFWGLGALAVILGSLAFSATLFEIQNVDWRLSPATHADALSFFLASAPFVWVVALGLFTLVGYLYVRRTRHGYRYPLLGVLAAAVLISVALGSGLYALGFGGEVDEAIGDHPPFYRPILVAERSWWLAPEQGLLGGEVASVSQNVSSFALRDFSGKVWTVETDDLRNRDLSAIAHGGIVRVIGAPASSTTAQFHACFVFPWITEGGRGHMRQPPPLAAIASTSGKGFEERSDVCTGIRPYKDIHSIEDTW